MKPTQLFVYGTLRHDQPEHGQFCRGVTGWRPARIRGRLWRIPEGYLLLEVPGRAILMEASSDVAADEKRRGQLGPPVPNDDAWPWVEGEVLSFRDAAEAWPRIDDWECFVPGEKNIYPRGVVCLEVLEAGGWSIAHAWVYAAARVPPGSVRVGPEVP